MKSFGEIPPRRHTCSQFRLEKMSPKQISCGGLGFGFVLHTKTLRLWDCCRHRIR